MITSPLQNSWMKVDAPGPKITALVDFESISPCSVLPKYLLLSFVIFCGGSDPGFSFNLQNTSFVVQKLVEIFEIVFALRLPLQLADEVDSSSDNHSTNGKQGQLSASFIAFPLLVFVQLSNFKTAGVISFWLVTDPSEEKVWLLPYLSFLFEVTACFEHS